MMFVKLDSLRKCQISESKQALSGTAYVYEHLFIQQCDFHCELIF